MDSLLEVSWSLTFLFLSVQKLNSLSCRFAEDLQTIRQNLGVCPQHDILFPELTALEHLQLYASFKGVPPSQIDSDAQRMINEVGLKEKANEKSGTLSGGQKRKVSHSIK